MSTSDPSQGQKAILLVGSNRIFSTHLILETCLSLTGCSGTSYTASKHALRGMTMNIASYYGKKGIRCNLVQPGGMDTELYKELEGNMDAEGLILLGGNCPALKDGSIMVPLDKMSSLIMFLSSDSASCLNGQILNADNGMVSSA